MGHVEHPAWITLAVVTLLATIPRASAGEDDETQDIVDIPLRDHLDYASLEASQLRAASALYFERCGVQADEGARKRAATEWNNLRTLGYDPDRLVLIAGRLEEGCEFVSLRSAVISVEKPPPRSTRSGGRRRDPLRDQAAVLHGIAAGELAVTALWGGAHGAGAARLAELDADDAIEADHRPRAQAMREGHLYSAIFIGVRVIPLVAAAELTRRTLRGEPRFVGAPYVILGGLDLVLGGVQLVAAIRCRRDRPILDPWASLQHLASFSEMVLWSGGILFAALGAIELASGLAGSPRPGFDDRREHAPPAGSVRLHPLPGGLVVQGIF